MSRSGSPFAELVHTYDLEVQEFSWYALVIDARSPLAFEEDHLPGAVNVPVVDEDRAAEASTTALAAQDPAAMPYRLGDAVSGLKSADAVLVYCDRGGRDAKLWAQPLKAAGFRVDVLGGGWINYRRWVDAGFQAIGHVLDARVLTGLPAVGLCRAVYELRERGEQVVDLAALAGQEYLPGSCWPCDRPPSQSAFETRLLHHLRGLSGGRAVWIRNTTLGRLALPPALQAALGRGTTWRLELDLDGRAANWLRRLDAMQADAAELLVMATEVSGLTAGEVSDLWSHAVRRSGVAAGLGALLTAVVDPLVRLTTVGHTSVLPDSSSEAVAAAVERWLAD